MQFVSASDVRYKDKARPFLESLVHNGGIKPLHLTVDYDVDNPVEGVRYRRVDSDKFRVKSPINCLQHGDFLPYVDDDFVVFTDCDIICQRPLTWDEENWLEPGERTVHVGYNNGEGDSLLHESLRLQPKVSNPLERFHWRRHPMYMPIYNTGVLAMATSLWSDVLDVYEKVYPQVDPLWGHYAKQQWLLSWIFTEMDYTVEIIPLTFHSHGCFNMVRPVPGGYHVSHGKLHYAGKEVFLRHNWPI